MNLDGERELPDVPAPAEVHPAPAAPEATVTTDFVVAIPGRRPDEAPIDLVVPDRETADRVRQLVRSGLRREEFNRAQESLDRQRQELALVEEHLDIDPIGFLLDRVRPEIQVDLAGHLLTIPEVAAAVSQELADWRDDEVRTRRQAELRVMSAKNRPGELERIRTAPSAAAPVEGPRLPPRTVKARRAS